MPSPIVALDLIKSSMRLVGIISGNQTPKANESNDALNVLNDLLEDWATDNLLCWGSANNSYPAIAGKNSYMLGPTVTAPDWVGQRPTSIDAAYANLNGVDYPIRMMGPDHYSRIAVKQTTGIPYEMWYINNFPNGEVIIYPTPDQAYTIFTIADQLLSKVATLTTTLTYPNGYAKALRWNLAVDLAAEYGVPVSPDVSRIATESKVTIMSSNNDAKDTMNFDPILTDRRSNSGWRGGDFS